MNNKKIIHKLGIRNTKVIIRPFGSIELKFVSFKDSLEFYRLTEKYQASKDLVLQILFNQLIKPKIAFDEFKKLSNKDIERLGKAFIKNELSIFKYYKDTGDFYTDFRNAVIDGQEQRNIELKESLKPVIKTISEFTNQYSSIIQQSFNGLSCIKETLEGVTNIAKQVTGTQQIITAPILKLAEQYQSIARAISESLKPQIDFWQKWTEQNKKIFDSFSNYWSDFQKKYNIAEQKAVKVLQKYKWFITPSFPMPFIFRVVEINKKRGRQDKAVNELFIKYFEAKNWKNLEGMVVDWKNKPLLKKRHKILIDCIEVIRISSKKGINVANVVLPTLISQIDGALTDYLNSRNLQWDCDYDDCIDSKTGKVKKIGRKTQFKSLRPKVLTTQLDDLANDIFLNILFQRSQKGKPLITPFNFNRHKIIHGESVKYGRKDYVVRAFMILDFLSYL